MRPTTPEMVDNGKIHDILLSECIDSDGTAATNGITEEENCFNALNYTLSGHPSKTSPKPLKNMWALIIGIEDYPKPEGKDGADDNPWGASEDALKLQEYLLAERGVPAENIVLLTDAQATRSEILRHFNRHLIENDAIQRNSPILFYYAGHGSRGPAPTGWAQDIELVEPAHSTPDAPTILSEPDNLEETAENIRGQAEDKTSQYIEYIVPYDSTFFGDEGGNPGIPDRTTRALIHQLAKRRGKNITVVFDCCHSGHSVRKHIGAKRIRWQSRGLRPDQVGQLQPDTDREIWGQVEESRTMSRSSASFTESKYDDDTYVLLAACARLETSFGTRGFGGVFTNAWLSTLREGRARTYAETLLHIKTKLVTFYKFFDEIYRAHPQIDTLGRIGKQQSQCEGFNRDRILFENTFYHLQEFPTKIGENSNECIIEGAGFGHGVKKGTMFELRRRINDSANEVLGSVIAQDVKAQECIAKLPEGLLLLSEDGIHAVITKLSDPVTFATRTCGDACEKAIAALNILDNRLSQDSPYYKRVPADQADLVLEVDSQFVHFIRQDIRLSGLDIKPPILLIDHIKTRFPDIMKGIARFNYYFSFEGEDHPFATQVEIRLHKLERAKVTYSTDGYCFTDSYRNMKPGDAVPWGNGEALIIHSEGDEQPYALVLNNNAQQDLFVYILLFDPSTYAIELFAQPQNGGDAALRKDGQAQFGRSANCEDALVFDLGDDNKKDTGYMKVILASEGTLNLAFMEQKDLLGKGSDGRDRAGDAPQPLKGVWDVMTRKLTVLPTDPKVSGSA